MSAQNLHTSLLRMPVLHILRAAGFHSTRPSVLDALVNITERYLMLLASATAEHALLNHNTPVPTLTDVRLALTDCGVLLPTRSSAEEEWTERLRRPLDEYDSMPYGAERRSNEIRRREDEDTKDVRDFVTWVTGERNKEIRRIAGLLPDADAIGADGAVELPEDYLTALKKKHSKTGEEARYQGTVLGKPAGDRLVKIEGGPVERLEDWAVQMKSVLLQNGDHEGREGAGKDERADEDMEDAPS